MTKLEPAFEELTQSFISLVKTDTEIIETQYLSKTKSYPGPVPR